jgi:hypothetical protein
MNADELSIFSAFLRVIRAFRVFFPGEPEWRVSPLDLWPQSPNVMRTSSSLNRCHSVGSSDSVSRLAGEKKRSFSTFLASMPASIKSTTTRLALVLRVLAMACTCFAMYGGSEML